MARQAHVTASYVCRLESDGAAQGIDIVDRLTRALAATTHELLLKMALPYTEAHLQQQARSLLDALLQSADWETLLMLVPLFARLGESLSRC